MRRDFAGIKPLVDKDKHDHLKSFFLLKAGQVGEGNTMVRPFTVVANELLSFKVLFKDDSSCPSWCFHQHDFVGCRPGFMKPVIRRIIF